MGQSFLLLSILAALLYGGRWYPHYLPDYLPMIIRTSSLGFLALFVLISAKNINHYLLFVGLIALTAGNFLLELPTITSQRPALMAFLGGNLVYLVLFIKNRISAEYITAVRGQLIALIWVAAAIAAFLLYPHLPNIELPFLFYGTLLCLTGSFACISKYPMKLVGFGSLIFLASSALYWAEDIISLPGYSTYVIWGTYYLSQLLIALGVILTNDRRKYFGGYRFD